MTEVKETTSNEASEIVDTLTPRLDALGLKKSQFAIKLGVTPNTITNWCARGKHSDEAEKLLHDLENPVEAAVEDDRLKIGDTVKTPEGLAELIQRDVSETKDGVRTLCFVKSLETGQSYRFPESLVKSNE